MREIAARFDFPFGLSSRRALFRAQLDVATMNSIAIFVCGSAGKRAWLQLKTKHRILTFLDNDSAKQGSRVCGVLVRDPEKYDYGKVEHVFIASMYLDEILVQLLRLGVHSSKIEYAGQETLKCSSKTLARELGHSRALSMVRRAFYIPFRLLR